MDTKVLTIAELEELSGVNKRTIRFYIKEKILHGAEGVGKNSHYDLTHLERLEKIRKLQSEGFTLARIREQLVEQQFSVAETKLLGTPVKKIEIMVAPGISVTFLEDLDDFLPSDRSDIACEIAKIIKLRKNQKVQKTSEEE
jgi:DNA-binding transcriptional MerR regulator